MRKTWIISSLKYVSSQQTGTCDAAQHFHLAVTHLRKDRMDTDNVQHTHTQTMTS